MSLIFGAIAGGLAGAGAAGEKAFARMHEHENQKSLEKMRADLMFEKESRLIELRHGNEVKVERDVRQPFAERQQKAGFKHAENLQEGSQKHAENLQKARLEFDQSWHEKTYALAKQKAAADSAYQLKSLGLQQSQLDKNEIWQNPKDGTYWIVNGRTKKIESGFMDPADPAKQMSGPLPMNATTKAMVEGTFQMSAALIKSLDPEDRKTGQAYYQLGMNMMRSKEDLSKDMPPPAAVAKFVETLKKGDAKLIEQAKSDLTALFPKYAPVVIESFAGVTPTPEKPGLVSSLLGGGQPDVPAAKPDASKLSGVSVQRDGKVIYSDETGTRRMVGSPEAFLDKFGVSPYSFK